MLWGYFLLSAVSQCERTSQSMLVAKPESKMPETFLQILEIIPQITPKRLKPKDSFFERPLGRFLLFFNK